MRILYLVHQFFPRYYAGTERFTADLAKQMQRMGHHPTIVTYDPSTDRDGFKRLTEHILVRRYFHDTLPVTALKHIRPADSSVVFHPRIEEAFEKLGTEHDLIHLCHPMWLSGIVRLSKRYGTPVSMTLTDPWLLCPLHLLNRSRSLCDGPEAGRRCIQDCGLDKRICSRYLDAKALFNMADKVLVASRFLATLFRSNGWTRKIRVIPHSVDYANVRRTETPKPATVNFGFIGTISWHKGVHVLVKAFRKVPHPSIRLRIYGEPFLSEQRNYFKEIRKESRKDPRIEFLEPFKIEELPGIMREISAIVIPSTYYENYPLAMLTSLAYRIPVIASNVGGIPEVIKDGFNGFLFPAGGIEELAGIIGRIAQEPDAIWRLRENIVSPRRVEEEALDYENVYADLTSR